MASANQPLGLIFVLMGSSIALPQHFFDALKAPAQSAPLYDPSQLFRLPNMAWTIVFDTHSESIENATNPLWFDLSPLSKIDKGQRIHEVIRDLSPGGWWKGRYAAIGSAHHFEKPGLIGVGDPLSRPLNRFLQDDSELVRSMRALQEAPTIQETFAKKFTESLSQALAIIHDDSIEEYFDKGKQKWLEMSLSPTLRQKVVEFTWEDYQKSDGLIDHRASLDLCRHSNPGDTQKCREADSVNHFSLAGYAQEVSQHLSLVLNR